MYFNFVSRNRLTLFIQIPSGDLTPSPKPTLEFFKFKMQPDSCYKPKMQQGEFIKVISIFDEYCWAVQATLSNCICLKLKISASKCQIRGIRMFLVAAYLLSQLRRQEHKGPTGDIFQLPGKTWFGLLKHWRCLGSESSLVFRDYLL